MTLENTGQDRWQLGPGDAAEVYQRHLVPAITAMWARALVAWAGVRPGERVLDVACGTGAVTRAVAEARADAGCLVGVDINTGMLAVARRARAPPEAGLAWLRASAQALPFPGAAFDVVFCQLGLQFFPDRGGALAEKRRVLEPGGRLAVNVFGPIENNPATCALADALDNLLGAGTATAKRTEHALADTAHLRRLPGAAGFHDLSISTDTRPVRFPSVADYVRVQLTGTPLASVLPAAGRPARGHLMDALTTQVAHALSRYVHNGVLTFPQQVHAVLAYR